MARMKVLFCGWYGHRNVGDDQYRVAYSRLFPRVDGAFADRPSPEQVAACDALVLGGGNVIDRHYLQVVRPYLGKVPVYAMSAGCTDSGVDPEDLKKFERIWVRDHRSVKVLAGLGVRSDYAPDAGWALEADVRNGDLVCRGLFERQEKDLYKRRVVVVLNSHLTTAQPDVLARDAARFDCFAHALAAVADQTAASFVFVPFGRSMPWDDRVPNSWVAHKCKWHGKNAVVWDELSVFETLDVLAAADAVVSMRFHSTLFALAGGTPVVDVTHHDKNLGLIESAGVEVPSVPYWDFSKDLFARTLNDLLEGGRPRTAPPRQREILARYAETFFS